MPWSDNDFEKLIHGKPLLYARVISKTSTSTIVLLWLWLAAAYFFMFYVFPSKMIIFTLAERWHLARSMPLHCSRAGIGAKCPCIKRRTISPLNWDYQWVPPLMSFNVSYIIHTDKVINGMFLKSTNCYAYDHLGPNLQNNFTREDILHILHHILF